MEPNYSETTQSMYDRLPEVYREADGAQSEPVALAPITALRNLFPYPSFEVAGGATVVETNLAPNPSMETAGANVEVARNYLDNPSVETVGGWASNNNATWTVTRDTSVKRSGAQSAKSVLVSGQSSPILLSLYDVGVATSLTAATPGSIWSAGVWLMVSNADGYQGRVSIDFLDASNVSVGYFSGSYVGTPAGVWTRATMGPVTAPAGTARIRVGCEIAKIFGDPAGAVDAAYADDAMLVNGSVLPDYFDGSTTAANDMQYAWVGPAHASHSTKVGSGVLGCTGGGSAIALRRTSWASSGVASAEIRVRPNPVNNDSYAAVGSDALVLGMQPGNRYTASATFRTPVALTGALSYRARIVAFTKVGTDPYVVTISPEAPTTGVGRVSVTFDVPVGATEAFIRLYNGSGVEGESVFVDDFMLTGTRAAPTYFDGTGEMPTNYALNVTGTTSSPLLVDGNKAFTPFYGPSTGVLDNVVVDLGVVRQINEVKVWHYHGDPRTYNGTKTEVSEDGVTWFTVFDSAVNGTYPESATGKAHVFALRNVRYIRDWLNGSDANPSNHWVEIQAYNRSPEFTYAWTGTPHNSTSTRSATMTLGVTGGAARTLHSSDWAASGTKSLRTYSEYDTTGSAYVDLGQYVEWGKTYTVLATVRIRETLVEPPGVMWIVDNPGSYTYDIVLAGGTAPGVYQVRLVVTFPAQGVGGNKYLRLLNSNTYGKSVWFDNVAIYEGDVQDDYFDGDTAEPSLTDIRYPLDVYSWEGTPHQSVSKRSAYEGDPVGYPLKRYISSVGDVLGEVRDLHARFDYEAVDGDLSDLVVAAEADDAWLDYIAQILGVGSLRGMTTQQKRTVLVDPSIGYRAGTPESIVSAASTAVGGSGYVGLYKFTTNVSAIGAATMWDILLVTRSGEAVGDVVQAVIDLGVKPAGVRLYWREWEVTWLDIHTQYPTWAAINALPNWQALEDTGI